MSDMREITYKEAVREAMCEEMRRDEAVYFMGEDIGAYCGAFGVSKGMLEEFGPDRVIETPISETAFVGAGVGSAITGMRPIVELMFSDFMSVCYDQIINQAAKMHFMFAGKVSVPMVIRTPAGGGTGAAAQHSQSLEQMYLHRAPGFGHVFLCPSHTKVPLMLPLTPASWGQCPRTGLCGPLLLLANSPAVAAATAAVQACQACQARAI